MKAALFFIISLGLYFLLVVNFIDPDILFTPPIRILIYVLCQFFLFYFGSKFLLRFFGAFAKILKRFEKEEK